jgi:hypothetical protein
MPIQGKRSRMWGTATRRGPRAGWLLVAGAMVGLTALLALAPPSRADVIPGAITSISTQATHVTEGDEVTFTCTWAVPDGSSPGDTFDLTLPQQLHWFGSRTFNLFAPDGSVVATAAVDTDDHVVFTLAGYVATHPTDVHGTCTFVTLYSTAGIGGTVDLVFHTGADVIKVPVGTDPPCTSDCAGSRDDAGKDMWWLDGAQTKTRSVVWTPATTADSTTVRITDTPGPGLSLDCASLTAHIGGRFGAEGKLSEPYDDATLPATVSCAPDRLVVTWTKVPKGEYAEVRVNATVTDPGRARYSNEAVVSFNGTNLPVDSVVKRTDASGTGSGSTPPPTTTTPSPPTTTPTTTSSTTTPPTTTTSTTPTTTSTTPTTTVPPTSATSSSTTATATATSTGGTGGTGGAGTEEGGAVDGALPFVATTSGALEVSGGALAFTGFAGWGLAACAAVLLIAGGALMTVARRAR